VTPGRRTTSRPTWTACCGSSALPGQSILVGHSAGGLYIRAYAAEHLDRVAGMVLVESSHEGQRPVLDPLRSGRNRLEAALMTPTIIRESLKSRRGGDRRSIIREWRTFRRVTDAPPALPPGGLGTGRWSSSPARRATPRFPTGYTRPGATCTWTWPGGRPTAGMSFLKARITT
jgi:pimeloyl-ACP methyl ester carboxylesterase